MGRQSSMAIKSAVYIAVRERLLASNMSDPEFASVLSKELNTDITGAMVSYYRTTLQIVPYKTRQALARREAKEAAARAREEARLQRRSVNESQQVQLPAHYAEAVNMVNALHNSFNTATQNLWAKLDEHEKRAVKSDERIRILEGRVTRLEFQVRATAGTLPNGWKIVDPSGNEIERISSVNGAQR